MTAPALLMVADGAKTPARSIVMSALKVRLHQLRPNLHAQAACVGQGQPSLTAATRALAKRGHGEAVCVPLDAARLTGPDPVLTRAVAAAQAEVRDMHLTLAHSLRAPGSLFSVLDQRLHDALARLGRRELDSLVLLHDGGAAQSECDQLARRARAWSARHRLPVTLAAIDSPSAAHCAVSVHAANGRRHVGIAWLSVFDDESARQRLEADPRVAAVAAPLGTHDAVLDAVVAQYSVAAFRALDDVALAS